MSEITEKEYRKLKQDVEDAAKAAERAKGSLDTSIAALKKDFGCSNLKEAKDRLAALELQATVAIKEFERVWKAYKEKWEENAE